MRLNRLKIALKPKYQYKDTKQLLSTTNNDIKTTQRHSTMILGNLGKFYKKIFFRKNLKNFEKRLPKVCLYPRREAPVNTFYL